MDILETIRKDRKLKQEDYSKWLDKRFDILYTKFGNLESILKGYVRLFVVQQIKKEIENRTLTTQIVKEIYDAGFNDGFSKKNKIG